MAKQVVKDALWVDVGDYFVTRDGRIFRTRNRRNAKKRRVREMKQSKNDKGYLRFKSYGKMVSSHRFVAKAFISNPDNLPEINHKNETPYINDVLSLEWCDRSYNINFGTRNERVSKKMTNGKRSKKLYQYALDGTFIREWASTHEVERKLGYSQGNIAKCCRGEYKTAYGYRWSYTPTI